MLMLITFIWLLFSSISCWSLSGSLFSLVSNMSADELMVYRQLLRFDLSEGPLAINPKKSAIQMLNQSLYLFSSVAVDPADQMIYVVDMPAFYGSGMVDIRVSGASATSDSLEWVT